MLNINETFNDYFLINAEKIFQDTSGANDLDLDGLGGKKFLRVLLKLIMHDYPPLVNGSLRLLNRHFNQVQEALIAVQHIQLLVSEDDINNYNRIKTGLDRLRILVEQSELWIFKKKYNDHQLAQKKVSKTDKLFNPIIAKSISASASLTNRVLHAIDFRNKRKKNKNSSANSSVSNLNNEDSAIKVDHNKILFERLNEGPDLNEIALNKYKELFSILDDMIELCVHEHTLKNGVLVKKSRKNNQRLLRNMGVHLAVLELTKITYEKADDVRMKIIMSKAHQFLQSFCFENSRNQILLHEKIDFTNYPTNEWEAATMVAIYKDNVNLCNDLNERLVQNFIHALENQNLDESKIAYLEFLQNVCLTDGYEIKKNQDMILDELMNSEMIHLSLDKNHIEELCDLMKKKSCSSQTLILTKGDLHTELDDDPLILFNLNLVKVLINCTTGKNTFTEIKSHTILSLEDIERVITNQNCLIKVKDVYVKFLYNSHMDTENESKEIITQPYIWSIFDDFIQDIGLLSIKTKSDGNYDSLLEKYILENVIEVIIAFFSHNQFNYIPSPHVIFLIIS
jgi:hypothetical protein